jgi:stress-induced morphogen
VIDDASLSALIRRSIPDARVDVYDRTGTMDHFNVTVTSAQFAGKPLLEQHRLVYGALGEALRDGRVHAVELTTIAQSENA